MTLCDNNIHALQYGRGWIVIILRMYGSLSHFLIFCASKTLNMSNDKFKIVWLDQYPHKVYVSRAICDQDIHPPQYGK